MSAKRATFFVSLAAALALLGGCGTPMPAGPASTATSTAMSEPASPLPTPAPQSPVPTPAADSPLPTPVVEGETPLPAITWVADGVIAGDEYDRQADFGDIRLWWRHDGTWLYLAFEGDTTGWVAVGINPLRGMQGADYLFGYVQDGAASLWDAYGTAPTGPNHPPDEDLGGTNDIAAFAGIEQDGITRFEVQIPLDSGDAYDHRLEPGLSYPLIVAIGGEDDYDAYHLRYDRGELVLP